MSELPGESWDEWRSALLRWQEFRIWKSFTSYRSTIKAQKGPREHTKRRKWIGTSCSKGKPPWEKQQELDFGLREGSYRLQQAQTMANNLCPVDAGLFYLPVRSSAFLTPPRKYPLVTHTHRLALMCWSLRSLKQSSTNFWDGDLTWRNTKNAKAKADLLVSLLPATGTGEIPWGAEVGSKISSSCYPSGVTFHCDLTKWS